MDFYSKALLVMNHQKAMKKYINLNILLQKTILIWIFFISSAVIIYLIFRMLIMI